MQKVVGSNPISRFAKGPQLRAFLAQAVDWTLSGGMTRARVGKAMA